MYATVDLIHENNDEESGREEEIPRSINESKRISIEHDLIEIPFSYDDDNVISGIQMWESQRSHQLNVFTEI